MSPDVGLPSHAEVVAGLARVGAGIDASELHGLVVGFLVAGAALAGNDWPQRLHVDIASDALTEGEALARLPAASEVALADPELSFAPLLPADDVPVAARADALFSWCRGFLAGFSLVPERAPLTEDAQEAFSDLAEIAAFALQEEEQDEAALVEVTEFTRLAVLLIHGDVLVSNQRPGRLH